MTWFITQQILVPFDFTDASVEAVKLACELVGTDRKVHVVHVMIDWYPTHPSVVLADFDEAKFRADTFEAMEKRLRDADINPEDVVVQVEMGEPGTKIAEIAEQIEASLIVIPSHGRRGIQRVFLGSVAERVVRFAECPVLVLKEAEPS